MNISNPKIDRIVCLDEGFNFAKLDTSKCEIILVSKRLTFADFYHYFKQNEINIIANNDIVFDQSISLIKSIMLFKNVFVALTRYDSDNVLFRSTFGDSQDVWAFYGIPNFLRNCDFYLGIPGCDSRIAYEAWRSKYIVINPSKTIKVIHVHNKDERGYSENDRLTSSYLFVKPINIFKAIHLVFLSKVLMKFFKVQIVHKQQKVAN